MLVDAVEQYKDNFVVDEKNGKAIVPEIYEQYLKHAKKSRNAAQINSFLNLSKSYLHIQAKELDSRWFELNTEAGIVDLRTGSLRPHDPSALFTKICPFSPSKQGEHMWLDHISLVCCSDQELMNYLQIKFGSYCYGKVLHEGIDIIDGGGRNGKSTTFNAAAKTLGDFAGSVDSIILTSETQNRGPKLATLRGKRLVICPELEEGSRLSIQTLKRLASTDSLTIEAKYKDPEDVEPTHSLVLFTNYLPRVGSVDAGTWRRLSIIPFNAVMPTGNEDVPNFADELVSQAGGAILQWMIDGARLFCENGFHFNIPSAVEQATSAYQQKEDWLKQFISERCIRDINTRVRSSEIYLEYKNYSISNGDYCRRAADFSKAMETAGFKKVIINGRPYWKGIRIDYAQQYEEPPPYQRYG